MERSWTSARTVVVTVVVGLLAAWTAWVRLGPVARGTAWAEDGGLFFREHLALGSVGSLLHPYAGYLHLVPRLVVDTAFTMPIDRYALTVSALCCLLVGGVVAAVLVLARDVVPSLPLRLVLAAVPVFLPTAPWEVSGNAANLHTFALFLVPWLFAWQARSWWGAAVVAVVTLLAVGTEVQAVLFLPLLVLAWWRRPGTRGASARLRALPVTVAALVASGVQLVAATTSVRTSPPGDPHADDVVAGYLFQVVGGLWRADLGAVGRAVVRDGWRVLVVPAVALVVVLVLAVVVALLTRRVRAAVLVAALAAGSVVVWTAALVANLSADVPWAAGGDTLVAATPVRYAATAGLLLAAAVVVAAAVLVDRPRVVATGTRRRVRRGRPGGVVRVVLAGVGWCVVTLVVASWVGNLPGVAVRSTGPEWQPQFRAAAERCRADPGGAVEIKTQPWGTHVPCVLVLRGR
jgi:hypothetical protein